jgi:hypothetical protein
VNGISLAAARRDLAQRHGLATWAELTRCVRALARGDEPPTPFLLTYRAVEDGDTEAAARIARRASRHERQ